MADPDATRRVARRLHFKHGAYYLVRRLTGPDGTRKVRWLHLGRDEAAAIVVMQRLAGDPKAGDLLAYMPSVYARARRNAVKRGIPFALSRPDFDSIVARSGYQCEVSGIPLSLGWREGAQKNRPWAPSLDRINSAKGYTADNCRLVCVAVNLAMSEWGEGVLQRIAKALSNRCVA